MLIIGCDYHPSVQQIAWVDRESGECGELRLTHCAAAEQFYRELKKKGVSVRVGIEATGHSRWFERLLGELNYELWVGDLSQIRAKRVRKQRNDRFDAQHILKLMLEDNFPRIWVPTPENRDVRQLVLHRHRLVGMRTRVMNQFQAIAMNEGIRRKRGLWTEKGRTQLESLQLPPWTTRRRQELLELLDRFDPSIEQLSQAIEQEAERVPEVQRLQTHPGVGPITALAFVLVLGTPDRFRCGMSLVKTARIRRINDFTETSTCWNPVRFLAMIVWLRDLLGWVVSVFRSREDLILENLALRQQLLALHARRPRRRLSAMQKLFWLMLRKLWAGWQKPLLLVTPRTVVEWHRAGFRLYWKWLSRTRPMGGRKAVSKEIRALIFRMAAENPTWGAPRIHGELLKLGFAVSEATVSRWLRQAPRTPDPVQRWLTFLRNHREAIAAMDFFSVPTLTFGVLYCFFIIGHDRRKILRCNVTRNPHALWIVQQLREAWPYTPTPRFLLLDRDAKFGDDVVTSAQEMGSEPVRTAFRSPWQNGVPERWVGSCRRDLLDHVIVLNGRHLKRLMSEYVRY